MMNSRDVTLISSATLIGAFASAIVVRFFFNNNNNQKHLSSKFANSNGTHLHHHHQQNKLVSSPPPRSPFDPSKRLGYLSWDDYFMAIAFLSAQRSKDPNRQVSLSLSFDFGIHLTCETRMKLSSVDSVLKFVILVGACLVSQDGVILGIGYNGFPRGCSDDKLPWAKKSKNEDPLETKYLYVCHAEMNAILNTNHASAAGQKLYVTMFPCNECAKIIIQSGVSEVIYFVEKRLNSDYIASHKLLSMAGVKVRKHQPLMDQICIKFEEL